eukprot:1150228-Rhodomonas_salina.1
MSALDMGHQMRRSIGAVRLEDPQSPERARGRRRSPVTHTRYRHLIARLVGQYKNCRSAISRYLSLGY